MASYHYLHGFASSPYSSKGVWLAERFAGIGLPLDLPDLNRPDFGHLTVSAMIRHVLDGLPAGPARLIGSSLGGLVAVHAAATDSRIDGLVLLAPALDFAANRRAKMGDDAIEAWRSSGWHDFYNYRDDARLPVHYGLFEDALRHGTADLRVECPILIIHGTEDESVSHEQSVRFAAGRPNVTLRLPAADHGMLAELPAIWGEIRRFFNLDG